MACKPTAFHGTGANPAAASLPCRRCPASCGGSCCSPPCASACLCRRSRSHRACHCPHRPPFPSHAHGISGPGGTPSPAPEDARAEAGPGGGFSNQCLSQRCHAAHSGGESGTHRAASPGECPRAKWEFDTQIPAPPLPLPTHTHFIRTETHSDLELQDIVYFARTFECVAALVVANLNGNSKQKQKGQFKKHCSA